jgi:hypothetical protein
MVSMGAQVTFRISQTLGLNPRWLSTIHDGRPRLRRRRTPTLKLPSRPASVKPMLRDQAHQQVSRPPEPGHHRFPMLAKGPHSYLPSAAPAEPSVPALPNYDLAPSESDAIITFSQTIEQVQTHGGGNMSRFPEVTHLLDNANNLRPKLARSLDDAGRKEGTPFWADRVTFRLLTRVPSQQSCSPI